jgi:hypothetical protein
MTQPSPKVPPAHRGLPRGGLFAGEPPGTLCESLLPTPLHPLKIASPLVEVIKGRPGFGLEALAGRKLIGEITPHFLDSFNQFGK